ncbi:MAG TPA: hypothetical protein VJY15_11080 [Candidatus Acidoferrum sp.]|nr:hypothetical protein [Candidatus Acidoferrum sp.]
MQLAYRLAYKKMQAKYPLKIQAIRSKNQQARLYVYFPLPLAAAIGLKAGEEVQWELLDRGELHLVREQVPAILAAQRATKPGQDPAAPNKQAAKEPHRTGASESRSGPKS